MCVCVYVNMFICTYVYMYVIVYMYIIAYMYIIVYMYNCIYVYLYINVYYQYIMYLCKLNAIRLIHIALRCILPSSKKCLGIFRCASSIPRQDRVMLSGFSCGQIEEMECLECKTPSGCSPITSHYITLRYTTLRYIALHDTSAWHSFSSGWAQGAPPAKKCTELVICTFCRSAQLRPNAPFRSDMAATSAPIPHWACLGPNFGANTGPSCAC